MSDETQYGEDALKDKDAADIDSGDEPGTPVHSPTIPEDEGNPGDGTGEGNAGPASGCGRSSPRPITQTNPANPASPPSDSNR